MTTANIKTYIASLPDKERLELVSYIAESLDGSIALNQLIVYIAAHWGKGKYQADTPEIEGIHIPDELILQAQRDFENLVSGKTKGISGDEIKAWIGERI